MVDVNPEVLFNKGCDALARGEWTTALACFEKAESLSDIPVYKSFMALCIAKERGQIKKAVSLCMESLEADPDNPLNYLNLGKVYLLQGKTMNAIDIFRRGLNRGANDQIVQELKSFGTRQPPPLSFLRRNNPLNKYLGITLSRLRLR